MVGAVLFRPRAPETIKTVRIKEGAFAISALLWLATLIPYTVSRSPCFPATNTVLIRVTLLPDHHRHKVWKRDQAWCIPSNN